MKILITGGAGFIGSHLCDALIARDDKVTIIDDFSTGSKKNILHLLNKIEIIEGDIRDKILLENLIQNVDLVLHMAAAVGVNTILNNPVNSISTNFYGSEVVLNAALKYDKRIIIASTSEIYGKNPKQPLAENDDRVVGSPQKLRWSYSDAKALEEAIAYSMYLNNNLNVTTLRFFNTVGPRQTSRYGMVIPNFVKAAISDSPIKVFGSGMQTRVFCHVSDVIQAILGIIQHEKTIGEVFNIGGTTETSIIDLAHLVIKLSNSNSKIEFVEYKDAYPPGFEDMQRRVPNIDKIFSTIGWKPKLTLAQIVKDVISYELKGI